MAFFFVFAFRSLSPFISHLRYLFASVTVLSLSSCHSTNTAANASPFFFPPPLSFTLLLALLFASKRAVAGSAIVSLYRDFVFHHEYGCRIVTVSERAKDIEKNKNITDIGMMECLLVGSQFT